MIKCANTIPFAGLMHAQNNSDYKPHIDIIDSSTMTHRSRWSLFDTFCYIWCELGCLAFAVWGSLALRRIVSYRPKCLFVYLCSESTERIYHRKIFCGKKTFVVIKYFYSRWVEFLCRSRNEYDSRRSGEGDGRRGEMGEGRRCANIFF